eukprot:15333085-Ditylum_brightwellii.AAC.1
MWHKHDPRTWLRHRNIDKATQRKWKASCNATVCNYVRVLHQPLGKWLVRNKRWQHWKVKNALYIKNEQGWKKHKVISDNRTTITYTRTSEQVHSKPKGRSPITDVMIREHHMESTPPMKVVHKETIQRPTPTLFREYITTLSNWEQRLLKHFKATNTSYGSLKTHIELGDKLWAVTDRGLKRGDGYFGWVIATDTNILWEGEEYAQSNAELAESIHTEGMAHLAAALFLKHYSRYYNITIKPQNEKHFTDNQ